VTHLDLKPPNILVPTDGGRLSIIDFNRSVHIKGTETMSTGLSAPRDVLRLKLRLVKASTARSARTCGPVERHWRSCVPCVVHPGIATHYLK
jgi:serine/threonine protein kinase